ncbi:MAG: hypothetical protein ABIA76_04060 [Candidatus Diapherotrites archaeon]
MNSVNSKFCCLLFFALFLLFLSLFACTQTSPADPYSAEFVSFSDRNFSFDYPKWGLHEPEGKLVSVASGGAIIEAYANESNAEELFKAMKKGFEENEGIELISINEKALNLTYKGEFQEHIFHNSVKLIRCNEGTYFLNSICVEEVCDDVQTTFNSFFNSVECLGFEEPEKRIISFAENDFSLSHPDWIDLPDKKENELKKLVYGQCLILLTESETDPETVFNSTLNFLSTSNEAEALESDKKNLLLEFTAPINSVDYKIKSKMLYCNDKTYSLTALCVKGTEEEKIDFAFSSLDSMECAKEYSYEIPSPLTEFELISFTQEDYSMLYPSWNPVSNYSIQTVLGVTNNACSLIVNKYESSAEALMNYLNQYIEENDFELISSSKNEFIYSLPFESQSLISSNKLIYCNYNTYVSTLICPEELNEEPEILELNETVFDSIDCAKEYIPSDVFLPEEPETEEPETPEQEPIPEEDPIVKTVIGEQYGLNLRAIVDFINSNEFIVFVLTDFHYANFVIEEIPEGGNINLKITLNEGKITLLEDGLHSDPDVALFIPFNAVMNIIENIESINLGNFLQFAASIRTEPPEAKTQVIKKVFEYFGNN